MKQNRHWEEVIPIDQAKQSQRKGRWQQDEEPRRNVDLI